ncbi:hypothetical protein ACH5RR_013373 [Cinchona calisaya]|uniref:Restriction endonuclease domain-containing protein n=1 Tax=Cinchona calisaya TaxID=153742 RepID=A0ABD2ZZV2_9GENT
MEYYYGGQIMGVHLHFRESSRGSDVEGLDVVIPINTGTAIVLEVVDKCDATDTDREINGNLNLNPFVVLIDETFVKK